MALGVLTSHAVEWHAYTEKSRYCEFKYICKEQATFKNIFGCLLLY